MARYAPAPLGSLPVENLSGQTRCHHSSSFPPLSMLSLRPCPGYRLLTASAPIGAGIADEAISATFFHPSVPPYPTSTPHLDRTALTGIIMAPQSPPFDVPASPTN